MSKWAKWQEVYISIYFLIASLMFILLYGRIQKVNKADVANVVSEIEFRGRFGTVVGYWAYGFYDPELPFIGQKFLSFVFKEEVHDRY